jgi:hypothetical protein
MQGLDAWPDSHCGTKTRQQNLPSTTYKLVEIQSPVMHGHRERHLSRHSEKNVRGMEVREGRAASQYLGSVRSPGLGEVRLPRSRSVAWALEKDDAGEAGLGAAVRDPRGI